MDRRVAGRGGGSPVPAAAEAERESRRGDSAIIAKAASPGTDVRPTGGDAAVQSGSGRWGAGASISSLIFAPALPAFVRR